MEMRSEQPFSIKMPISPVLTQPSISTMRLTVTSDGTAVYKPINPIPATATLPGSSFHGENAAARDEGRLSAPPATLYGMNLGGSGDPVKKKRGRPRKYSPDGNRPVVSRPSPERVTAVLSVSDPMKKTKARSSSSLKKQQQLLALGSSGTEFTPHVLTVKAGEDVSSKIMSFSQNGPHAICILSANGSISNVTLGQAATSGGTVTYEGRFEILSLSGSFMLSESDGQRSRTGGLSISLAGPDGRVIGGGIAGLLMAASPVQVVVGSFIADGKKDSKHMNVFDGTSTGTKHAPSGNNYGGRGVTIGGSSPPSLGTPSGSSGGPPSPFNQSAGAYNNSSQQAMYRVPWK